VTQTLPTPSTPTLDPSLAIALAKAGDDIHLAALELDRADPIDTLAWAVGRFGRRLTFATGFGPEGCVLIDLIGRHALPIDVFTLDTELLFPETRELWTNLEDRYGLRIRGVQPQQTVAEQAATHGDRLWERAPDRCCQLRKVFPLRTELAKVDAWITAIRRDQTAERAGARVVERDARFGIVKVNPLVRWTRSDVWSYLRAHDVPYNQRHDRGFPSIGCLPCTSATRVGEGDRAGRWRGSDKTECGLHGPVEVDLLSRG